MQALFYISYSHFLIFLRNKTAIFIFCVFPVIIFSIFGTLWGMNSGYIFFLLSGIIGMNTLSDGLSSIGPVVKESYNSGLIKYLKKQSFNPTIYFVGYILCRIIILIIIMLFLCLSAQLLFQYKVSLLNIFHFIIGIFVGMFIFSFIGLCITYLGSRKNSNSSIINLINYFVLFSSDVFYPTSSFNKTIATIGNMLPLNPILTILRGEGFRWELIFWVIIPIIVFLFMLKIIKFSR